jgi:hypothetical protein
VALEASRRPDGDDTTVVELPAGQAEAHQREPRAPDDEREPLAGEAEAGYVPPPAPPRPAEPSSPPECAARDAGTASRRRRSLGSEIGVALILAAALLVVVFVVVPLIQLGRGDPGADPGGGASAAATASAAADDGPTVLVPDTIGMTKDEAIAAATEAGLDWTIRCAEDASQPEGMIDQEPAAGTEVRRGSRFTMYSARVDDCR